ncbi:MAG: FMN-binding negative transcriptional regulator [Chloroflexota bacterium]
MYIPRINQFKDQDQLVAFLQQNNFATHVSIVDCLPVATQHPVTVTQSEEGIWIRGHFARANRQWKEIGSQSVLVMFTGPHAYISTTLYEKWESVPTWNYIAVHAYGEVELVHAEQEPDRLEAIIVELINTHEAAYQTQWDQLSDKFRNGMKRGIVGFELTVTRLEGKAKLSQNKTESE